MATAIRLLYVDDEPDLLEIGKMFLEESGDFTVTTALSAQEAIRLIEQDSFDAVVSDYQMPGMDGIQFLVEVRRRFGQVPFILFTGRGREEVVIQAINSGADFYIQKGGEPGAQFAELSHKIKRAVGGWQAEDALRKSERWMHEIIDNAPYGAHLYELKPEGQLVFIGANKAADLILNVKNQQFIGKTIEEAFPPLIQTDIPDAYRRVAATGEQYDSDQVDYADDGGIHGAFEVHASQTGPNLMATFFRDITERKRIDMQLRENETRFRALVENASDIIRILDREGRIIFDTESSGRLLGYPPGFTLGKNPMEFIHPDDLSLVKQELSEVYDRKNSGLPTEFRIRKADGSFTWVESTGKNLIGVPGVDGIVITTRFIDERKLAELKLLSAQERLKEAHHLAHIGTWDWKVETDTVTWSEELCDIAGWDPSKPAPSYAEHPQIYTPASWELLNNAVTRALSTGESYNLELELVRPDGSRRWTNEFGGVNRDMSGKVIGLHGTVQDITERKRAEELLTKSQHQLGEAMDLAHLVNWEFDVGTGIFTFNDRFYALFGTTAVQEGGYQMTAETYAREFLHPDDQHLVAEEVKKDLETTDPHYQSTIEHRIIRRDGEVRYVLVHIGITKDAQGRTIKTHGANQDITDLKRAEEGLRESENKYRRIVEQSLMGIGISEGNQVLFANKALLHIFNYDDLEEFKKIPLIDHVAPSSYQFITERMKMFAEGKISLSEFEFEYDIICKGGLTKTLHAASTHVPLGDEVYAQTIFQDITGRKQAEDALRESEEKYRSILENIQDVYYRSDTAGNLLMVSPSITQMLGYDSVSELLGKNIAQTLYYHPEERSKFLDEMNSRGSVTDYEVTLKKQDGTLVYVSTSSHKYFDHSGNYIGVEGIFRDISERKQFDDALQKSEEKYRRIIETANEGLWVVDQDMNTTFVNQRFADMIGYSREEITGHNVMDYVINDDKASVETQFIARRAGIEGRYECKLRHRDGRVVWCLISGSPLTDDTGSFKGSFGMIMDITERKRAEDAHQESEARYRLISENTDEVIWTLDYKTGKFTYVSPSVEKLRGYTPDEVLNQTMAEALTTDSMEAVTRLMQEGISERKSGDTSPHITINQVDQPCKDGSVVSTGVVSTIVFDEQGHPVEIIGISRNITERKRAEEELRKSEEKFHALVDQTLDGIIIVDLAGNLLFANTSAAKITGYALDIVGKANVLDIVSPEFRLRALSDFARIAAGTDGYLMQYKILTHEQKELWIECIGKKISFAGSSAVLLSIRDITQRLQDEEALRESEKSYRGLFNTIRQSIYILNPDGTFMAVNEGAEAMYGYAREEFIGRTPEFLSAPGKNDLAAVKESVRKAFAGESQLFEFWGLRKGGEIFPKDVYLYKGTYFGKDVIVAVGADITERKRAEELVSESENKFASVFNGSPVALTLVSAIDGKFVNVNDAFVRATGFSRNEVVGKTSEALGIFADDNERNILASSLQKHHIVEDMEIRCRGKTGEIRPCLFSSGIILIDRKPYILSSVRDITVRKQMEEALKDSNELFSQFMRHSPIYTYIKTVTQTESRVLQASDNFEQMIGIPGRDMTGKAMTELFPAEIAGKMTADDWAVVTKGEVLKIREDMNGRNYLSIKFPIVQGGKTLLAGYTIDITERTRAEEALRQANKKLTLLSGITRHDIKNQLLVLNGFLGFLQRKVTDPTFEDYFTKITNASARISAMIQFTREYESIGVKAPVWQDCRTLVETAGKQALLGQVIVKNDLPAGAEVFSDPLIVKVFYNLMDNAVRYGGKITTIRFAVEEREGDHLIVCEDDGDGVVDEEKEKIFERGFGKNTGLGLALSREILLITGITICENGEPGKGARFEMTVPKVAWRMKGKDA